MRRRKFLQLLLGLAAFSRLASSCRTKKEIKGTIVGASASIGHLLRDKQLGAPVTTQQKKIVIIGAGISGLSAARCLHKNGLNDFVVLDLEKQTGGNAACGKNAISSYPWGAHYIPIPNNDLKEYMEFLTECNVITGMDATATPVYNDYYLCFDPKERLYINGRWQEGIIPNYGLPEPDRKQIEQFLLLMEAYRFKKGADGKDAFAIPVDNSSKDTSFTDLDLLNMKEWMLKQGFTSGYLHWYVNYCTRDDFGTPHNIATAWAGIHYFASRKGRANNAKHDEVLTWPEGTGWLVKQLQAGFEDKLQTNSLVVSVKRESENVLIDYLDVSDRQVKRIVAEQCILAVPQFISSRLLSDDERMAKVQEHFHYMPWMVANLTVNGLEERSGAPMSWDNVIYGSDSLGYVKATHELVQQNVSKNNLTYYLPLPGSSVMESRKIAHKRTHKDWVDIVLNDLKKVHPNIENATEEINIMLWGHAMVQPKPGLIHGSFRQELAQSINNQIHFAHTDLSGISIFEEGFYQGVRAAKNIINVLS